MNKKFLSAILFGALVATTGSFVSCADNDDKINQLENQNGELKAQLAQLKSDLQAELKTAASASQVAAIEAKLNAIEGATSENVAAVVAALKGDFSTQEAKVVALAAQIEAIEKAQLENAEAVLEALNKAKENANADVAGISAMVDALDADVNVLVSALRGLVFQPEFYVDGIEAAEYTYLKYAPLSPTGDKFGPEDADLKTHNWTEGAWSTEPSIAGYTHVWGAYMDDVDHRNWDAKIHKDFVWGYAHIGNIVKAYLPTWDWSSLWVDGYADDTNCYADGCLEGSYEYGWFVPADDKDKEPVKTVGDKILNTMKFAVNPSNAKVTKDDLAFVVKNICAMTRANEASITVESADVKDGILIVEYWIPTDDVKKLITANNDQSYGVLNQKENTTIVKLQSATATENGVESDWAALYETSIQPVAVALNEKGVAEKWNAPIACAYDFNGKGGTYRDNLVPNELHKNPYEMIGDVETAPIEFNSKGIDIAEYVALHFVKRDDEKIDRKHAKDEREVQCPHVTMTLDEAAHKFGFTYEFALVPWVVDENKTNNSAYAHLKKGLYDNSVIVPNTVDEGKTAYDASFNGVPKKATDKSQYEADGYEQGVSSVDKEPIVQVLVKSAKGEVILDAYVKFVITRKAGLVISPVFDLGAKDKDCDLSFSQTWNQVSELLYEQTANKTLGMSKLEFEEAYTLEMYPGTDCPVWYDVKLAADGTVADATVIEHKNTFAKVWRNIDTNGITNSILGVNLDKYDQQYIYEKSESHDYTIYVKYVRRGVIAHSSLDGIIVPLYFKLNDVVAGSYGDKDVNFWYAADGTVDITPDDALRLNVNYAKDLGNTYNQTDEEKVPYFVEGKFGFVRDLDDAWMGKTLVFKNAKGDVLDKIDTKGDVYNAKGEKIGSERARYYFHPFTNNVVVTDPVSGEVFHLAVTDPKGVTNDFVRCDIWKLGYGCADPTEDESSADYNDKGEKVDDNVKFHEKISGISKKPLSYISELERDHQVDTRYGIYKNTILKAYTLKKDKDGKDVVDVEAEIAQLNPVTGHVQYFWIDETNNIAKRVLNALGHAVKENADGATEKAKVYVGVYRNTCDWNAYYIGENVFPVYFLRPLDIIPGEDKEVVDAKNNGDYVTIFDMFNFQDWRDIKFVDGTDYSNIWLAAYYGINKITVNVKGAMTNLGNSDITKTTLASVNQDIKLTYVDKNKNEMLIDANGNYYQPADLSTFNKESMGVKSTYEALVKHFGMIKYENKGANVSDFDVIIPVTLGYDWGEINTKVKLHVKGTIANNGGK